MKHKIYILLLAVMAVVLPVNAATMAEADALYAAGDFLQAAVQYESIVATGMESADLYYNLGNAYYRMGKIADAIINYERALRIDANHEDALHNLAFVERLTVDKIDPVETIFLVDWWKAICRVMTPDAWAYTSVALFVLCLLSIGFMLFSKVMWMRKTGFSVAVVALFFTVVTAFCASSRQAELDDKSKAVIYVPTVTIKSSPDEAGKELFILHEGTRVIIKSSLDKWVEIQTEAGSIGWLPASSIVVI